MAVLGTTISPYLFFWQAEEEVEIEQANPQDLPLKHDPKARPRRELHRIRVDTYTGMAFSNLVAFFIILTAAATLHAHGITDIQTSTQAAAGAAAHRGPVRLPAVRAGHHRDGPAGGARAGRARRPTPSARPCAGASA